MRLPLGSLRAGQRFALDSFPEGRIVGHVDLPADADNPWVEVEVEGELCSWPPEVEVELLDEGRVLAHA